MTGHAIRQGAAICLEPDSALCRADWNCDCEYFSDIDKHGELWVHTAYGWDEDLERMHTQVGVLDPHHCNYVTWLNNDGLWDTFADRDEPWSWPWDSDFPDGLISVVWNGDCYEWEYADPRALGRLIGRSVVAAWADELGIAA
ncbi:MAG: hypothetical protein AB7H92_19390 [Microbacteriaceae bacterium]